MFVFNIKFLNKISAEGVSSLTADKYNCGEAIDNPDGIIVRSAKMHDYPLNRELLAVARAGAGVNNIPIDSCSNGGVVVFNTPGANANAVKELVICAMLISSRDVVGAAEWAKTLKGKGSEVPAIVEKGKSAFSGPEIKGKSLGVIGLGAVGALVANCALGLGMTVYGYDPYISVAAAWGLSRAVIPASDYKTIYEKCDYITIHAPLVPETKEMINKEAFSSMKTGVRIINLARGELVCETDLTEAIDKGIVACYVTDFPSDYLIGSPNVIPLPHLGASTPESEENCAVMASAQLGDFLENGNIKNSVNLPDVSLGRIAGPRLGVIHKNIPNMVGSITAALAGAKININEMSNRSKKDMAYTLLDISEKPGEDVIKALEAIQGIIRVRVI